MSVHLLSEREAAGVEENYTPIGTVYFECCVLWKLRCNDRKLGYRRWVPGCISLGDVLVPEPVDIWADAKYCTKTSGKMIRC